MNDDISGGISESEPRTDWQRLRTTSAEDVHAAVLGDPDAQPTDDTFWEAARVVLPTRREAVTLNMEADVLEWLRSKPGLEATVNAILREYMDTHRR